MVFKDNPDLEYFLWDSVTRSMKAHKVLGTDHTKAYLVTMLSDFCDSNKLFENYEHNGDKIYGLRPITFQMFECGDQRWAKMPKLGNHCLFLVGYFYDFVLSKGKGQVKLHQDIGSGAYLAFADYLARKNNDLADIFSQLGENFSGYELVIGDLHLPSMDNKKTFELLDKYSKTLDHSYEALLNRKGILSEQVGFS